LDELKRMPTRTNITHQACDEGWPFIAEWTGVPLSYVLNHVGTQLHAKWVVFHAFDRWWDSLDMPEALHPQTLLAFSMNGAEISVDYGAPLRLRVPRQLGYKSQKYLSRITVVDSLKNVEDGQGSIAPAAGYSWFAGI
jgi:DMSO/TMAO reductase YedYZ molybdopterin-dependent catalytic subunit